MAADWSKFETWVTALHVIHDAWPIVLAGTVVIVLAIWGAMEWRYGAIIDSKNERIAALQERLALTAGSGIADNERAQTSADRHLFREQKIALSDELKRLNWHPESVTLRHLNGCVECLRYAADFSEAFKWAGWTGKNDTTLDADPELTGVQIVVVNLTNKPREAELLASALKHAGVEFQWSTWAPPLITPVVLFVYPTP